MLKHNKTSDTQHCPALIRHEFKKTSIRPAAFAISKIAKMFNINERLE